jgi:hypothetical protein
LFILSDDLYNKTGDTLRRICNFLDVSEDYPFVTEIYRHHIPVPTKIKLYRFLTLFRLAKEKPGYWRIAPFIRKWQDKLPKQNHAYPPMKESTRSKLRSYFARSNNELAIFLGVSLDHWQ